MRSAERNTSLPNDDSSTSSSADSLPFLDAFRARHSEGNTEQSAPSDASHHALTLWVSAIHVLSQSLRASAIVSKVPSQ